MKHATNDLPRESESASKDPSTAPRILSAFFISGDASWAEARTDNLLPKITAVVVARKSDRRVDASIFAFGCSSCRGREYVTHRTAQRPGNGMGLGSWTGKAGLAHLPTCLLPVLHLMGWSRTNASQLSAFLQRPEPGPGARPRLRLCQAVRSRC